MSKTYKKPENKVIKEKKPDGKKYKVRSDLGFKKRNYFIDNKNKNVLLIAGEIIDEETFNLFNDYCKKTFFEV